MKKRSLLILFFLTAQWFAANTALAQHEGSHSYKNGICTIDGCTDKFEPAIADPDGWYQLGNVGNVEWFADYIEAGNTTAKAVLTADIDYKDQSHTPIGQNETLKFNGVFDGQHHHIKNLTMTGTNTGFFGYVCGGSTIRNIIIDATCSFTATERCGSLIGIIQAKAGGVITISNIVNYASVTSGSKVAGGILAAGATNNDHPVVNMSNCVNVGRITCTGADKAAGLLGWNKSASNSTLKGCYNIGECTPLDGVNNLFRGNNRAMPNCYDLTNTTAQGKTGTQGLKTDWLTLDPLHSGELCYVLNTGDMSANGIKYTQDLSDPNSIPLPIPGMTVYQVIEYNCDGSVRAVSYNNTAGSTSRDEHVFDPATGLCTRCSYPKEDWLSADADGFYYLGTPEEVEWFSHMVKDAGHGAMNVKLTADIDFGGVADAHMPIGTSGKKYFGHFDGQGHRIKGMVLTGARLVDNPAYDGLGFFGSVRGGGTSSDGIYTNEVIIENLIIDASCSVNHNQNFAAGLIAHVNSRNNNDSHIIVRYCGNEANVSSTGKNVAGIVGCVEGTEVGLTIMQCYNKGNIYGGAGESAAICGWTGTAKDYLTKVASGCWNIGEVTGIDGNGYNLFRVGKLNNEFYPAPVNCVDLCTTNGGNQGKVTINTTDPVASGELCYLLNGDQTNIVYTQTLGTDEMPVYGTTSLQVYQAGSVNCIGAAVGGLNYNNVSGETTVLPHEFNNDGICDVCHTYEVPTLENEYYQLDNYGKLKWFETQVNEGHPAYNAELLVDLDFYEKSTCRIGNGANSYRGTFKGNDHVISNFNIATSTESVQGFFGWITGGADISGIVFDNTCSISCVAKAGIIGGAHNGGTIHITRLGNEGSVTTQNERAAGIIGTNDGTACVLLIDQCYSTGTISGNSNCSQIAAYTGPNSKITNSWACSEITKGANNGRQFSDYAGDNHDAQYENCFTTYHETNTGLTYDTPMTDFGSGKVAYATGFGQNIGTDAYPGFFGPEVLFVGTAGYTTFYDSANDWKLNGDAQAYIGTLNGNYLQLSEIDDVPAGTAVIIGGTYYNKVSTTASANATGNDLLGSDGTVTGGSGIYALANKSKGIGFYPVSNSVTIPAGKVYLQVAGNAVREFYPFGGEETTSLNEELRVKNEELDAVYDLSGRLINSKFKIQNSKLRTGIYIQNGKKVIF